MNQAQYKITTYLPQLSKPEHKSHRLVVVTYKTDKETNIKKPSICTSIPQITTTELNEILSETRLHPHLITYLQDVQNKIIREKAQNAVQTLYEADLDANAIIQYLEAESSGGRITKELVSEWFTETLQDSLLLALSDKLTQGEERELTQIEEEKITTQVSKYKELICSLSGGKTSYSKDVATKLLKCFTLLDVNNLDDLGTKLFKRLEKMTQEPQDDGLMGV